MKNKLLWLIVILFIISIYYLPAKAELTIPKNPIFDLDKDEKKSLNLNHFIPGFKKGHQRLAHHNHRLAGNLPKNHNDEHDNLRDAQEKANYIIENNPKEKSEKDSLGLTHYMHEYAREHQKMAHFNKYLIGKIPKEHFEDHEDYSFGEK